MSLNFWGLRLNRDGLKCLVPVSVSSLLRFLSDLHHGLLLPSLGLSRRSR